MNRDIPGQRPKYFHNGKHHFQGLVRCPESGAWISVKPNNNELIAKIDKLEKMHEELKASLALLSKESQ
jgi:hypothetical protein